MKTFNDQGFTLVELLMMCLLLPILFLSVFTAMNMANMVFRGNNVSAALNQNAIQTLRYISREIGQTSPNTTPSHLSITTSGSNSTVRFQIPVDHDNDGDAVTSSMNPAVEWGIYDEANQKSSGRLGGWAQYSVSNNQLIRDVLDSSLAPVSGLSRVVANNVQAFTVTKSSNNFTMSVTLQASDDGGGGTPRTFQTSFSTRTMLRNAVN